MSVEKFVDDDQRYLKWVADNPDGYVLNVLRSLNANLAKLHKATCWTISRTGGGPWTGEYIKVGSTSLAELRGWTKQQVGPDIPDCKTCQP